MTETTVLRDVPYGAHERNILDLYIPHTPKNASALILFIHGGGWTACDKSVHEPDAQYWSGRGYICCTMNYRYVDAHTTVYDVMDDVTNALRAAVRLCGQDGICLEKLLLSGGSAGGHLCLLYALTRADEAPVQPAALFVYCPATDCTRNDFLAGLSGDVQDWKNALMSQCCGARITKENFHTAAAQTALAKISPIAYVSNASIPVAICHGLRDDVVPYSQSVRFLKRLVERGVPHDLITYENFDHMLQNDPDAAEQARQRMQLYLENYFDTDKPTM